ncbi:MAG: hypothetical protein ACYC5K_10920 [Saccharofermentanales bacterium]
MMDEKDEKEFLEKISKDKTRKQDLSIELETVSDDDLLRLIKEMLADPLF